MKFVSTFKASAAAAILALVFASSASASTANTTFQVTASVQSACVISAAALPFGNYSGTQVDATTTISVTCTNTTPYNVGLDAGTSTGATVTARKMTNGAQTLNYALYSDSGRTVNWGNSTGSWVGGTGNGSAQTLTVYGRLAGSQYPTPGSYADTITATVNY
jgi:spore coat protein U-like protein